MSAQAKTTLTCDGTPSQACEETFTFPASRF
jgi:hypothetical protein